jgi:CheY-like chemotaxis protein
VEDEEALAVLLKRQLEAAGYRVTVHTSSLQALEDFRAHPNEFDLLLTDNTMPRMTGFALSQEVLKIRPELPVLMVSGLADGMDPEVLRARGIRSALRKPHTRQELCEAIEQLLAPTPRA